MREPAAEQASSTPGFTAKERFPEIFSQSETEQAKCFASIHRMIQEFRQQNENVLKINETLEEGKKIPLTEQRKFSHKTRTFQISHSLFCLSDGRLFRFFITPHKNIPRKKQNLLGEGTFGQVIPAYELVEENRWRLSPHAEPSIALKIFTCPQNKLDSKLIKISREMEMWKLFYPTEFSAVNSLTRLSSKAPTDLFANYKIYIPMPYFPGIDGDQFWLNKNKTHLPDFLEALRYCISVLDAMIRSHDVLKMLNGDVKPQNFRLHQGRAQLLDFGLSRLASQTPLNPNGVDHDTLFYAPLEKYNEGTWRFESEIYAIGLSLYELLAGEDLLIYCQTEEALVKCLRERKPRINQNFLDAVPIDSSLKAFLTMPITAMVDGDPKKRPALSEVRNIFAEVLARIESTLEKHPLAAQKTSEPEEPESPLVSTPSPSPF